MSGLMTMQGSAAPAQAPAIPPVPSRPGAGTGATAAPASPAQAAGDAAGQAVSEALNRELSRLDQIGQPTVVVPPPYRDARAEIAREVIPLVGMVGGMLMTIILGYPIIKFIIRLVDRRLDKNTLRATDVTAQLRALQDSVDTMAIELERISEGQRFTAKLMAERDQRALAQGEAQPR